MSQHHLIVDAYLWTTRPSSIYQDLIKEVGPQWNRS